MQKDVFAMYFAAHPGKLRFVLTSTTSLAALQRPEGQTLDTKLGRFRGEP
jgi:hypothetical protein